VRRFVDAFGRRMEHAEQSVADELQGVLGPRLPFQNADERSGVPAVDRAPQLGPFLPVVHAHILLAARRAPRDVTGMDVSHADERAFS
jgi:hypothetical protein